MKIFLSIGLFLLGSFAACAQDLASIQRDLKDAQARLTAQREKVTKEKPALAKSFAATHAE
ncbi:MAG: hypothetical protein ACPG6P_13010, partial [Akkermansiaceae bacterium]